MGGDKLIDMFLFIFYIFFFFKYFIKGLHLFPQTNILYLMCLIHTIQYFKELYKL